MIERAKAAAGMAPLNPALEQLYPELKAVAQSMMRRRPASVTLQPTALVHEAYLRLADRPEYRFTSRKEFFALAARVMREVLADSARRKGRKKRGSDPWHVTFTEGLLVEQADGIDALAFHQALERLNEVDPQAVRIVELRFVLGLSVEETADTLDVSAATVKRDTATSRAWLLSQLGRAAAASAAHE